LLSDPPASARGVNAKTLRAATDILPGIAPTVGELLFDPEHDTPARVRRQGWTTLLSAQMTAWKDTLDGA